MSDRDKNLLPRAEFNAILKEWTNWRETTVHFRESLATRISVIETRGVTWAAAIAIFVTILQIAVYWVLKR